MGCDQGHQDDQVVAGPPVNLVGQNVGMVGGTAMFPADGIIRLTFDRLLLPITVTRQAFVLTDSAQNALTPLVDYDPVARVVSLSNPAGGDGGACWLQPSQFYTITLPVAPVGSDLAGLRAIDRATLAAQVQIGFQASATPCGDGTALVTPRTDFCADVLPIFVNRCSVPTCHGTPMGSIAPAAGLALITPIAFRQTAVGRTSQAANTGAMTSYAPPGHIFGVNMPIVDPGGDPGNSWLLYKLLLAIPSPQSDPTLYLNCGGSSTIPPFDAGPGAQPMSASERAILANFVQGREMPYPYYPGMGDPVPPDANNGGAPALSFDELERVRAWLQSPQVPDACPVCTQEDAGMVADSGMEGGQEAGADGGTDAAKDGAMDGGADGAGDAAKDGKAD